MKKRIIAVCLAAVMVAASAMTAFASEVDVTASCEETAPAQEEEMTAACEEITPAQEEEMAAPCEVPVEISANNVSTPDDGTWTGSPVTPAVTVTVNGTVLTEGEGYTLTYANNLNTGRASVTVTGMGDYTGTVTKYFTIRPTVVTNPSGIKVTYTGTPQVLIKPAVVDPEANVQYCNRGDSSNRYAYDSENLKRTEAGTYSYWAIVPLMNGNSWIMGNTIDGVIEKAPLTAKAKEVTIKCGEEAPDFELEFDGFVNGETKDVLEGTAEFSCDYKAGDPVGEYPITVSGLTADNYEITYEAGTLKVEAPEYTITGGVDPVQTYTLGSKKTLSFTCDGALDDFTGLKVDGAVLDAASYTAVSGSTVVTLSADYLETLSAGDHSIVFAYKYADSNEGTFKVEKAADSDQKTDDKKSDDNKTDEKKSTETKKTESVNTGDSSQAGMWAGMAVIALAAAGTALVRKKRSK